MAKVAPNQIITDTAPIFGYMKGVSKWAKVLEVDDYGKYSINVYADDAAKDKFSKEFETVISSAKAEVEEKGKKVAGTADFLKSDDEGNEYFAFKLPELDYNNKPNKIEIYDVFGKKQEDWDKLIGNGSVVKVKFMAKPYYMASTKMVGVSCKFYAVQVIDLVEYSADSSGFGDESEDDVPWSQDANEDF